MKKGIEDKMQVGFGFGGLLERFFIDFEPMLGAKLDQVGTKIRENSTQKRYLNFIFILIDFEAQHRARTAHGGGADGRGILP